MMNKDKKISNEFLFDELEKAIQEQKEITDYEFIKTNELNDTIEELNEIVNDFNSSNDSNYVVFT